MQWGNWNPNQEYHIGDSVIYQGRVYHIIQPHISQADWTPPDCPALWGLGGPAGSELGKHPGPQDRHSPPPYHRGGEGNDRMPGMGFDRHRDAPWDGNRGIPEPERHRGIPDPEPHRAPWDGPRGGPEPERYHGVPEPEPHRAPWDSHRGVPEPERYRGVPEPEPHRAPWDSHRGVPEPERHRGIPDPGPHRGFPEPGDHRGPPQYMPGDRDHVRDWDRKDDDRDREHHRDREFGSRGREQVYEAEDRAMREGHQGGGRGGGAYCNPTKYNSSAEWIDDARRRAREFNTNGPRETIYWLLAEPGQIPKHAIQAGEDREGNPTFVARNFHEGGLHVGWAGLQRGAAISYGGGEIPLTTFEVLAGDPRAVRWVASTRRDGRPIDAGYEANGNPLWICQAMIGGKILAGKTAAWDSGGYIASDEKEEVVPEYNVLCHA